MPILLAIETSSEVASVALLDGDRLITRYTDGVLNHSQAILPMVQAVLQEAGVALSDCAALAFGCGPGSFTGVRTACGVVQGLAFGADLEVVPVITLEAIAEQQYVDHAASNVLAVLDARMGEVYWAQYLRDPVSGKWQTLTAALLSSPADVFSQRDEGLVVAGHGVVAYADQFRLEPALLARAQPALPGAAAIARLAYRALLEGRTVPASEAQPLYLRNKIALTIAEREALVK